MWVRETARSPRQNLQNLSNVRAVTKVTLLIGTEPTNAGEEDAERVDRRGLRGHVRRPRHALRSLLYAAPHLPLAHVAHVSLARMPSPVPHPLWQTTGPGHHESRRPSRRWPAAFKHQPRSCLETNVRDCLVIAGRSGNRLRDAAVHALRKLKQPALGFQPSAGLLATSLVPG